MSWQKIAHIAETVGHPVDGALCIVSFSHSLVVVVVERAHIKIMLNIDS